jgi:crotonobetainyl-CoA:carnitine CoA-transferase CaiB-like acyl-CoA transferase
VEDRVLAGVRVVDRSTGIAGPYCTRLLALAGADVHVEEPAPDPLRTWRSGGLFDHLREAKRLDELPLAGAHVLVAGDDLDVEAVRAEHPDLVVVTVSPFGLDGPWAGRPATEFTLQAACGSTGSRGDPDGPPLAAGGRIGEWLTGTYAALATVAALRTGRGEHVDVAMLDCMTVAMVTFPSVFAEFLGWPPLVGTGRTVEVPSIEPTSDGWIVVTTNSATQFQDFVVQVGKPEWLDDEELRAVGTRFARRREFLAGVHEYTTKRTSAEVLADAGDYRIPAAPVLDGAAATGFDQFVERGVHSPSPMGGFRRPRPPFRITPGTNSVPKPAAELPVSGPGSLPLAGVRVLDLTAWWAGPAMPHALACLGADVVKVESVARPDPMRFSTTRPGTPDWYEWGPVFHAVNTGKRGVTLDLRSPQGIDLFERLARTADVVVENFTPRVLDQFGLGWERVHELNSRLVLVRMPAFGLDGPWRDRTGFAQTMESIAGMAWLTGFPDGPPVLPRGVCDPLGGMHAAFACLAALRHRDATGEGSLVESVMVEAALNVAVEQVIEHDLVGVTLQRQGNRSDVLDGQDLYRCAGDDAWVAVAATAEELGPDVAGWCAARTPGEAADELCARGVPAAAVIPAREVARNPQLRHRGLFEVERHPLTGDHEVPTMPFRFASVDAWLRRPSPTLGQHNDEVLAEVATADELAELRALSLLGERLS